MDNVDKIVDNLKICGFQDAQIVDNFFRNFSLSNSSHKPPAIISSIFYPVYFLYNSNNLTGPVIFRRYPETNGQLTRITELRPPVHENPAEKFHVPAAAVNSISNQCRSTAVSQTAPSLHDFRSRHSTVSAQYGITAHMLQRVP